MKKLKLAEVLAAANLSTVRSRAILFILTGASIIAFSSSWKSMQFGWYHKRLQRATAAVDYFEQKVPPQKLKDLSEPQKRRLAGLGIKDEEAWQAYLNQGMDFAQARGFANKEHARDYLSALERLSLETVGVIHLPIFGVSFDINDLGMLAGIAFVVLLVTFRLALARELQNVRIAFRAAHEAHLLKEGYEFLSMYQVMTIPPAIGSRPKPNSLLVRAPMLLVWLPFAVQSIIFANDFFSMHLGEVSSAGLTIITLLITFASVFVIFILTAMCWNLSGMIDHEWSMMWHCVTREHSCPGEQ